MLVVDAVSYKLMRIFFAVVDYLIDCQFWTSKLQKILSTMVNISFL